MTVDIEARPLPAARNARAAVAVLFFTNGALFANLLPRYPQIKEDLAIGNGAYGLAVAAFPAGPSRPASRRGYWSAAWARRGSRSSGPC